jgi:hypothetical protein
MADREWYLTTSGTRGWFSIVEVCEDSPAEQGAYERPYKAIWTLEDGKRIGVTPFPMWVEGLRKMTNFFEIEETKPDDASESPRELTAVQATTKPKSVGEGAEPHSQSPTEDDRPSPDEFRVYHATEQGIRQETIAHERKVSQPTISRIRRKVADWLAKGNKLPSLDELPKPESRPRMISVDPAKMERVTEDDHE